MPAVMVQGCTSWAGKSLLATGLCRWYADRGLRVAAFKGQNMSNNARVVDGGELGVAQWLQARAARVEPDVRMGPVLVKPEHGSSQVVVLGRVDAGLSRQAWTARPGRLWPVIQAALQELLAEFDLVVCEGAGSPAETNLLDTDLANMRVARAADAPVLLVADIDRGGAFAHLYGTWALLPQADRARLAGFVLNKFRGDPALLRDGPADLARRTGMAYAGLVPMLVHRLPDEDGAGGESAAPDGAAPDGAAPDGAAPDGAAPVVAVVRYPAAGNLDEFAALAGAARLRWVRDVQGLDGASLVVLPGSKHVSADLAWLRSRGLAAAVVAAAAGGTRVLGICGGLQMLGDRLVGDGDGLEDTGPGLGLLPVTTCYGPDKLVSRTPARFAPDLPPPWTGLSGIAAAGYDIRQGRTSATAPAQPADLAGPAAATVALPGDRGWVRGSVLGVTCHGLFEDARVRQALLDPRATHEPGATPHVGATPELDATFDALAEAVETHLDTRLLERLTGGLL